MTVEEKMQDYIARYQGEKDQARKLDVLRDVDADRKLNDVQKREVYAAFEVIDRSEAN
jgi:hypothetical protein